MKAVVARRWPRFSRLATHIRATLYGVNHPSVRRMVLHNFKVDTLRK